ncbi:MAG TPA: T9SS type A sorting domain-containing protein [Bacteroidia bacterium]|nr:T9SS type A sorting domain-containing protein [Bacteroidia bacterium]HRG53889.1 T9SS type A sorting domain-containing protein [Bacteroidia bacterium]
MNRKIVYLGMLLLPVLIMAKMPKELSFGAPVSSSGAPGEVTCAHSGCHDDGTVNSGKALLQAEIGDNIKTYIPGKTYPIKVRITEAGVNRFGFQVVALKNSDQLNAGDMAITDAFRTQIITNEIELKDRRYVTYTYEGTEPFAPGVGEWTMNWTAPDKNVGPVTVYIASVSANNDNTDKGDHVYTTALTLSPDEASTVNEQKADMRSTVFFSNASKELNIALQLQNEKQVQCLLYTIEGRLVKMLFDERIINAEKKIGLDVPHGVYLVKLTAGQDVKTTKIVIQ